MLRTSLHFATPLAVLMTMLLIAQPLHAQKADEQGRVDSIIERSDEQSMEDASSDLLYVCNQGDASVSVIDMENNEEIARVDLQELGFSGNASPHHAIAEADGSHWYVALINEHVVLKFNRENELVGQTEFETPGMLALHPETDDIYIARSMMATDPPQSIGVANRQEMGPVQEIETFFPRPHALIAEPNGRFIYTASLATNQILSFDTQAERPELTTLGGDVQVFVQFAVTPDGNTVIGGGQTTRDLFIFDAQDDGTLAVSDTLEVGAAPWHPIIDSEGQYGYVPNKMSNSVSVVDINTREVVDTIEHDSFREPHGSALSADGRYLYISNNNRRMEMDMAAEHQQRREMPGRTVHDDREITPRDTARADGDHEVEHEAHEVNDENDEQLGSITVIDTETREVVKVIEVGEYATGIGTRAWR